MAEARNMAIQTGSIFMPVWRASRPRTSCRYRGTVKKTPMRMRFWVNSPPSPDRSVGILMRSRCTSGSAPVASRRRSQRTNPHSSAAPPAMTNGVSENPNGCDRGVLGMQPAPGRGLQRPQHDGAQPDRGQDRTQVVQARDPFGASGIVDQAGHGQDEQHQHHLAHEDDPPRQLGGGPATHDGTHCDAGTGHAADHGVGGLAFLALEVPGDQRRHGRKDERRADPLEDRPTQRQDRHRLGDRGQGRSAPVDDQTDRERPSPADDVADLAAGEHQHGHHQAVEGDHRLDHRDRGVEVRDQLADRHVHHRLIEDHHELRGRQRDQWPPPLHATTSPVTASR